jgi:hypothetical protein
VLTLITASHDSQGRQATDPAPTPQCVVYRSGLRRFSAGFELAPYTDASCSVRRLRAYQPESPFRRHGVDIYRLQRHRTAKAHESFLAPSNARQTLQAVQRAVNSVTARGLCSRYGKPRKGSQMGYLYQEDRAPAAPKPQSCLADVVLTIVAMFAIMFLLR